ncbi:MAG: hypothetical protein ACK4WM_08060 [Thermoflexales bacterium]
MSHPSLFTPTNQPATHRLHAQSIARLVSHLTHPPIVAALGVALLTVTTARTSEWWWAVGYAALAILAPTLFIAVQVRRGKVGDFQLQQRQERIVPYAVALGCAGLGVITLWLGNAPRVLQRIGWMTVLMTLALLAITLRWKISAHCAYAATFAVLGSALLHMAPLLLWGGVLVIAWARVTLRRHDLWQTLGGAVLGAASALLVLR